MANLSGLSTPLAVLGEGLLRSAQAEAEGRQRDATARAVAQTRAETLSNIAKLRADSSVAVAQEATRQEQLKTPAYQHTANGALTPKQAMALQAGMSVPQVDVTLAYINGELGDIDPADLPRLQRMTSAFQRAFNVHTRTGEDMVKLEQSTQQRQRNDAVEALVRRGATPQQMGQYLAGLDAKPLLNTNGVDQYTGGLSSGGRELANIDANARVRAAGAASSRRPLEDEIALEMVRGKMRNTDDMAPPYQAGLVKDITGASRFDPEQYAAAAEAFNQARSRLSGKTSFSAFGDGAGKVTSPTPPVRAVGGGAPRKPTPPPDPRSVAMDRADAAQHRQEIFARARKYAEDHPLLTAAAKFQRSDNPLSYVTAVPHFAVALGAEAYFNLLASDEAAKNRDAAGWAEYLTHPEKYPERYFGAFE